MSILVTSKTSRFPGPQTSVNCPKCGPNVPAATYRLEERMGLFFIPLITQRETYLECSQCGSSRLTNLTFEELAVCPPDEIDHHIYQRISIIVKVLALASVVMCCIPFIGIGLGIAGFFASKRAGGWVNVVSLIGIVLSTLATLVLFADHFINNR